MSGESYDYNEPEGGVWMVDQYGVAYWSPTGEPGVWEAYVPDPAQITQFRFVADPPVPMVDYAGDFEAAEDLVAEFGVASDWDEPFAPEPLPFRTSGWQDAAECTTCKAIGLYGIVHLGCGGLFTIIYQ